MSASVIFCAAALALMLLPYVIIIGLCAVAVSRRSERGEEVRCGDRMATVSVIVCVSHEDVAELSKCVGTLSLALRDGDEAIFVADQRVYHLRQDAHAQFVNGPGYQSVKHFALVFHD